MYNACFVHKIYEIAATKITFNETREVFGLPQRCSQIRGATAQKDAQLQVLSSGSALCTTQLVRAASDMRSSRTLDEGDWPITWSLSDSSQPVTNGRNNGIRVGDHERLKSQTSRLQ